MGTGKTQIATYEPATSTWHISGQGDARFGGPGQIAVSYALTIPTS
jgi:hypothetical protein